MKRPTPHYTYSMPIFWVLLLSAFLLLFVQWQFSRLTGSSLVFGQALLQLSLCIFLLFNWLKPRPNDQLIAQFITSFFILGLCGFLINESYIHWIEQGVILTNTAFPVVILGIAGVLFLTRLTYLFLKEGNSVQPPKAGKKLITILSVVIILSLFTVHVTGWVWLDALMASLIGLIVGVIAIFFLLDSYWSIMEVQEV